MIKTIFEKVIIFIKKGILLNINEKQNEKQNEKRQN